MLDWIGSLQIRDHTPVRVVLGLSRSTQVVGLGMLVGGLALATWVWSISVWLAIVPSLLAFFGALLVSLRRELVVDREAGVLRVDQGALGIGNESVVPLFHLRAVVIMARPQAPALLSGSPRYVAYLDRRVGDAIYLDESRRCAGLLKLAEAIAEVAELRLEYEATPPAAAGREN